MDRRQALTHLGAAALTTTGMAPAWAQPTAPTAHSTATPPATSPSTGTRLPKLVLSGPPASVSTPLIHMVESNALADVADQVSFVPWKDPDQLRLMAIGSKADILAMPSNVAANLYNKGVPVRLINISTWGVLWMVSRNGTARTLADFKGQEIAMPFREDMPDLVFALLTEKQGLNPKTDFKLRYVASPLDAMQLLVTRRVDHALLAEPAVSMALRKTQSFPISVVAPSLFRSVDLQHEWGRLFNMRPRLPQAGIAAVGAHAQDGALQTRIAYAYARSLSWCLAHKTEAGVMVAKRIDLLSPEAVADSLTVSQMEAVPAGRARYELEPFYTQLLQRNPALVGGKLPDAGFYPA